MTENPFAPHLPASPRDFVDRDREVELIFGHISAVQRGSVAVNSALGLGKTSLLRYIADPEVAAAHGATAPRVAILYVDIQSVTPFSAERFWHRVAGLLKRNDGFGLDEALDRLLSREDLDVIDLEEFLDAVSQRGQSLVLLLDEFEWALQADSSQAEAESRNLLAQLASLMRRTPRVLSLVVATEAPLVEATRVIESWRGSPFATLFTSVTLKPLPRQFADQILDRALARVGAEFSAKDRDLLYAISGGVPASLQAGGFALFHGRHHQLDEARIWDAVEQASRDVLAPRREDETSPSTNGTGTHSEPPRPSGESAAGLRIDHSTGEVFVDGRRADSLTALEYNLLECLHTRAGRLCTKEEIVKEVWGEALADDSRVEKLVSRLRRKIEPVPGRPQYIRTVRGRGYRLVL
jgi:hypothetical protein